jgi:ABC-type nitrate/sulfonate/bicarbonate transport system ATPase subunit
MITLTNISKQFNGVDILTNINCQIRDNELLVITGPSGSGKTTLLKLIAGTLKADNGTITLSSKRIGFVFQDHRLLPWKTSFDNIALVLKAAGMSPADAGSRAQFWLEKVGLGQYARYYPSQLSGGMVQRVSIARAFAIEPDIILMDEPFSSLGAEMKDTLLLMVKKVLMEYKSTVVYVTHDIMEAIQIAHRLFELGPEGFREIDIANREAMMRDYCEMRVKAINPSSEESDLKA